MRYRSLWKELSLENVIVKWNLLGRAESLQVCLKFVLSTSKNMACKTVNLQSPLKASDIKLQQLKFGMDQGMTVLQDDQDSLQISSPHFRASATVEIPELPSGANIQIGWIQVCTEMTLVFVYGDVGITSWEIPELVTGKYTMISDSDSVVFPWYGATTESANTRGPTEDKSVRTVTMDDNLITKIWWTVPKKHFTPNPTLTFVYRKQKFYTYLAMKDIRSRAFQILKTLEWSMEIAIDVDVNKPMGKRSTLLGPLQQQCPKIVPEHLAPPLKCYALYAPTCNTGQLLMWRPYHGHSELLQPSMSSKTDPYTYAMDSNEHSKKLMLYTKENFLSGKI